MTIRIPTTAVVIGPDEPDVDEVPRLDHLGNNMPINPERIIIWFRSKEEALQFYGQLER